MSAENIRRCTRCIMPASVPGVTLDAEGVCNFCRDFKEITYKGRGQLDAIVEGIRGKGEKYDVIVPMSGGRDSTYALHLARNEYGLRALAVSYDNEFRHDQADVNIAKACEITGTEFVMIRSKEDIARKIVRSMMREEISLGYVKRPVICRACSYGIKSAPYREAEKHGVPLIMYAGSQEEKVEPMILKVTHARPVPLKRRILGKLNPLNPRHWEARRNIIKMKKEFPVTGNSSYTDDIRPDLKIPGLTELHIFDYIPWDRKMITETITSKLGWERTPGHRSSWRNDCQLHQFINYDFFRRYGCSRDCFGYCRMIQAGKMAREDALVQEEALLDSYNRGEINGVNIERLIREDMGLSPEETAILMGPGR